jgi:predicted nuclease with TOPRIM domain
VARIEAVKAAKKAADDKAALDAVTRTVESAQQAVNAAQRNLDAVKARLAQGQATQADVDAAQRALDEATGRLTSAQAEAARLAEAAKQSAQNAADLDKRADDLASKVPEGAVQPRGKGPTTVSADETKQAGEEGFFSKYSTELILGGAVLAIGGYFAWQKYGKK